MAKTSEAARRAARKYKVNNTLQVNVTVNKNTDPELFEFLGGYEGNAPQLFRDAVKRDIGLLDSGKTV